jgi:type I restriction enzyme S subunit
VTEQARSQLSTRHSQLNEVDAVTDRSEKQHNPAGEEMDRNHKHQVAEASAQYLAQTAGTATPASHDCPPGYKRTEVGVIPEDWEVCFVGDVCDLLTGFPFPSSKYSESGVRLLRGSNVKRNCTDWSEEITQYWPEITSSITQYELKIGDIVISMDGSLVGRSFAQLCESDLPAVLLQRVARLRSETISQSYLKEWICSRFFTEHCDSVKTVTAIPHISPQDIRSFKLLIPTSKEEQTAIANALSDVDALISELEKLIAKKQAIKTATMQQLLTGRTRLPQFALREDGTPKGTKQSALGEIPEDWEVLGFGTLFQPSVSKKPIKPTSLVSFVGMQDVTEDAQLLSQHLMSIENVRSGFTYFERGDVLVAKITPCFENGKGCHTESLYTDIGFGSTEFHVLRATDNSDSRFIYYWSNSPNVSSGPRLARMFHPALD